MPDESQFQVRIEPGRNATLVFISGDVNLTSSPDLRDHFRQAIRQQPPRLIVDLSGVAYMDSSGVGTVVELKRLVERYGGKLVLCGLQPRVLGVFEITHLRSFFTIAENCDQAQNQ